MTIIEHDYATYNSFCPPLLPVTRVALILSDLKSDVLQC